MGDVQTLVDMGFEEEKVQYALKVTNYKGVEPAMEWLLAHADEAIPKESVEAPKLGTSSTNEEDATAAAAASSTANSGVAKSLKCEDCGKVFRNETEMQFHASKSGHTNFSESTDEKPELTAEERKEQLSLIEEKLKQKRLEREERERMDALEREKNRIKSGKDMTEARKKMEELEMKKLVEERKREKAADKAARDRVKAQIEADKAARKAKEQKQSVEEPAISPVSSTTNATDTNTTTRSPTKNYAQTRIQIRLNDGSTLTETFKVKEQLSAVRVFIQMRTGVDTPFRLMTTFPRKIFSDEEYEKPLDALGLVPSAVLTMTKGVH